MPIEEINFHDIVKVYLVPKDLNDETMLLKVMIKDKNGFETEICCFMPKKEIE